MFVDGDPLLMNLIKSLWASVQGDPTFMRRVNGWLTIFWIVMIPVSIVLGLLSSVAYVSALSLWALVSGHWSAWQAARVEVAQASEQKALDENPVEDRVVEQLVAKTDISSSGSTPDPPTSTIESMLNTILERVTRIESAADLAPTRT